jgi:uncharacterized linocin/CFP29 family protein
MKGATMNDNLGRDKIWTPEVWGEIDKAVKEEWKQRVAQTVIKTVPMDGAANVASERIDLAIDVIPEGQVLPFVEISREFTLTESQVENETTLRNGLKFARISARLVAMAEDAVIFQGQQGFDALVKRVQGQQQQQQQYQQQRPLLRATNLKSVQSGLLGFASTAVQVNPVAAAQRLAGARSVSGPEAQAAVAVQVTAVTYRENTVTAVFDGIAKLRQAGHPGPYALFLSPLTYADAYSPISDTLQTPADRLLPILKGGLQLANELPDNRGLLISLGGEPVTIYLAQDIAVAFNQKDTEGNYRFRAFERVQVVARETSALVRMEFQ